MEVKNVTRRENEKDWGERSKQGRGDWQGPPRARPSSSQRSRLKSKEARRPGRATQLLSARARRGPPGAVRSQYLMPSQQ